MFDFPKIKRNFAAETKQVSNMDDSQIISLRLSKRDFEAIEKAVRDHKYWKRNALITQVVISAIEDLDWSEMQSLLEDWRGFKSRIPKIRLKVEQVNSQ